MSRRKLAYGAWSANDAQPARVYAPFERESGDILDLDDFAASIAREARNSIHLAAVGNTRDNGPRPPRPAPKPRYRLADQQTCPNGHPSSEFRPWGTDDRVVCRLCLNERKRRYRAARRKAA